MDTTTDFMDSRRCKIDTELAFLLEYSINILSSRHLTGRAEVS